MVEEAASELMRHCSPLTYCHHKLSPHGLARFSTPTLPGQSTGVSGIGRTRLQRGPSLGMSFNSDGGGSRQAEQSKAGKGRGKKESEQAEGERWRWSRRERDGSDVAGEGGGDMRRVRGEGGAEAGGQLLRGGHLEEGGPRALPSHLEQHGAPRLRRRGRWLGLGPEAEPRAWLAALAGAALAPGSVGAAAAADGVLLSVGNRQFGCWFARPRR